MSPDIETQTHPRSRVWLKDGLRPDPLVAPHPAGGPSNDRPHRHPAGLDTLLFGPSAHLLVDAVIAAAALGGSLVMLAQGGLGSAGAGSELDLLGAGLAACTAVPLLAWRRAPFGVFVVTAAVSTLAASLGYALGVLLGAVGALYLLAASRHETRPWTFRAAGPVVALVAAFLAATAVAERSIPLIDLVHSGLPWALAWFAGERTRLRREHIAALEERAVRAEHEAERSRRRRRVPRPGRTPRRRLEIATADGSTGSTTAARSSTAMTSHPPRPSRLTTLTTRPQRPLESQARKSPDMPGRFTHVA